VQDPGSLIDRAASLRREGDFVGALTQLRAALTLAPHRSDAHNGLGLLLRLIGEFDGARRSFERAIALDPGNAEAHANLAASMLLDGDYEHGLDELTWTLRVPSVQHLYPLLGRRPLWAGEALRGRHLLVIAEQGFGDTISMLRYLPLLGTLDGTVTLAIQRPLFPLVPSVPAGCRLADVRSAIEDADCWIPILHLPWAFKTTVASIPAREGYLRADVARVAEVRRRLRWGERDRRPRIGIAWGGNPLQINDRLRSIPFRELRPLRAVEGVRWISLQRDERERECLAADAPIAIEPTAHAIEDFGDLAALVASCDLVVTVDTAVAHLTGALGHPGIVLLSCCPDWRWARSGDRAPWYTSLHPIRKTGVGPWEPVVEAAARSVTARLVRNHPPAAEEPPA
jgi:hypothetical protein